MPTAHRTLTGQVAWMRHAARFLKHRTLSYFQRNRWVPLDPPGLSIETTSVCNSRCVFCPNGIMERPRQAMKMEVFKKTVEDAAAMGAKDVNLFVTIGDPLLDPQLLERAHHLRKAAPRVRDTGFYTTLQWLHLFPLDEFFECGFTWIYVSTVLSGRDRYRDFFGVDKYDQMLANLETLLKENNHRGRPMSIEIGIKPTPESREAIIRHPDFQRVQSLTSQDLGKMVRREDFFACDWSGSVKLPEYLRPLPLWPREHRPCNKLFQGLMVFSNGKVGACACRDFEASSELILGSVQEQTLSEMWHGEKLVQIRSDWQSGKRIPDVCQNCRSYDPRAVIRPDPL